MLTIPLNKLTQSPLNVRRHINQDADLQLRADIHQRGLLQNLVVAPIAKPKGHFEVLAGGRRLAQLKALAQEGHIAKTHPVECLSIEGDDAARTETSLAENFQRLNMNPADECNAFQRMIELGSDVDGIARRFGLTARFIEGRLRLAALAPVIFEALRDGKITLDIAKAYGSTSDQHRQTQIFEQVGRGYGSRNADSIRDMISHTMATGDDRRARLVGREAYIAAGGRIERDLFTDRDSDEQWIDIAILERLACQRMEEAAAEVAATTGLGWITPTLNSRADYDTTRAMHPVQLPRTQIAPDTQGRINTLQDELELLAVEMEDESLGEADYEAASARASAIQAEITTIAQPSPDVPDDIKPLVGGFLVLSPDGVPTIEPHLWANSPVPGFTTAPIGRGHGTTPPTKAAIANKDAGLSQSLVDELAMQRRDILAVHIANDPGFALDLSIFLMADQQHRLDHDYTEQFNKCSTLQASAAAGPVHSFKTPDAPATRALTSIADTLDRSWTSAKTRGERFDLFRALSDDARASWLSYTVARTLEASLNLPGDRQVAFHDHLGQLLEIDIAHWWRPTAANFFSRVSKPTVMAGLNAVGGPALAQRFAAAKKADLAASCERIFSGDFIAEVGVQETARTWVPDAMQFKLAGSPSTGQSASTEQPASRASAIGEATDQVPSNDDEPAGRGADGPIANNHVTTYEQDRIAA